MKNKIIASMTAALAAAALAAAPASLPTAFGTQEACIEAQAAVSTASTVVKKGNRYYSAAISNGYLYENGTVYKFTNHYMSVKKAKKSKAAVSGKNYKKLKKAIGKATAVKNNGEGCNGGVDYVYTYSSGGTTVTVYTTDNKITAII